MRHQRKRIILPDFRKGILYSIKACTIVSMYLWRESIFLEVYKECIYNLLGKKVFSCFSFSSRPSLHSQGQCKSTHFSQAIQTTKRHIKKFKWIWTNANVLHNLTPLSANSSVGWNGIQRTTSTHQTVGFLSLSSRAPYSIKNSFLKVL